MLIWCLFFFCFVAFVLLLLQCGRGCLASVVARAINWVIMPDLNIGHKCRNSEEDMVGGGDFFWVFGGWVVLCRCR